MPDNIRDLAWSFNGLIHGDDDTGAIDIEMPTVRAAVRFIDALIAETEHGWNGNLRPGQSIRSLYDNCTITIHPVDRF
jgi:hypothetical protein